MRKVGAITCLYSILSMTIHFGLMSMPLHKHQKDGGSRRGLAHSLRHTIPSTRLPFAFPVAGSVKRNGLSLGAITKIVSSPLCE